MTFALPSIDKAQNNKRNAGYSDFLKELTFLIAKQGSRYEKDIKNSEKNM